MKIPLLCNDTGGGMQPYVSLALRGSVRAR
jgi:hypothetical protein